MRVIGTIDKNSGVFGLKFSSAKTFHRMQFRFLVPPIGATSFLTWGTRGGESVETPETMAAASFGDPGQLVFSEAQSTTCDIGGVPIVYLWDDDLERGLLFRMKDLDGVGKRVTATGQTTSTLVEFDVFPPNRRDTTHVAFAQSWELQLRPMLGDDWTAAAWHGRACDVESHPGMARGSVANGDHSATAREARLLYWGSAGTDSDANWAKMREDVRRLSEFFGTSDIVAYISAVKTGADGWPTGIPVTSGSRTQLDGIVADGSASLAVYTIPPLADADGAWMAATSPSLSTLTMRNHAQTPFETSENGITHQYANLGHASARSQLLDFWKRLKGADGFASLSGQYLDAVSGGTILDDFATAISASSRGVGTSFSLDGNLAYLRDAKAEFDFIMLEWLSEHMMADVDLVSAPVWDVLLPSRRWAPVAQWAWQNRALWFSFYAYGTNPLALVTNPLAFDASLKWSRGQKLMLAHILDQDGQQGYLIPEAGEDEYATRWVPAEADFYAFLKTIYVDSWDVLQPFREGVALPPLPNSQEQDIRRNGWSLVDGLPTPSLGVHSFARYASGDVLAAFANWKTTPQTFDATMTTRRYPWLSGARQVYEVNPLTGAASPDGDLDGNAWTKSVELGARSLRVFKITGAKPCSWLSVQ